MTDTAAQCATWSERLRRDKTLPWMGLGLVETLDRAAEQCVDQTGLVSATVTLTNGIVSATSTGGTVGEAINTARSALAAQMKEMGL